MDFSSLAALRNSSFTKTETVQTKDPGPQLAKYDTSVDRGMKKFKDGRRFDSQDKICKRRYSLIYVTALQNVPMTVSASSSNNRLLQNTTATVLANSTEPKVSMNIVISSEYFSSPSKAVMMTVGMVVSAMVAIYF